MVVVGAGGAGAAIARLLSKKVIPSTHTRVCLVVSLSPL